MRKIVLNTADFDLFDSDITQPEFEFFQRHKDVFKQMFVDQVGTALTQDPCLYLKVLVNIPAEGIRLLDTMCLLLGTPRAVVWSQPGVVYSEKVTFDPLTR